MKNSTVRKIGAGVIAGALMVGMGGVAANAAKEPFPGGDVATRLQGADRVATSLAAAKQLKEDVSSIAKVYLVGHDAVVDAAVAGVLEDGAVVVVPKTEGGQLLLGDSIKKITGINKLVALGGETVLPDSVLKNVAKFSGITDTSRIGGADRYETAVAINRAAHKPNTLTDVFLTRGDNVVDALSLGAASGTSQLKTSTILVNPTGTVSPKVVEYYKEIMEKAPNAKTVVIGGENALSSSQVKQLVGESTSVDPWTYVATEAELKKAVQKAAALYLGQGDWQHMAGKLDTTSGSEAYFGEPEGAVCDALAGTSEKAADVDITKCLKDASKTFIGYKTPFEEYKKIEAKAGEYYDKAALDLKTALNAAVGAKLKGINFSNDATKGLDPDKAYVKRASGDDKAQTLAAKFYAFYGFGPKLASVTSDEDVTDGGAFTFNDANEITGINQAYADSLKEKALEAKDSAKVSPTTATLTLAELSVDAGLKGAAPVPTTLANPTTTGINYPALKELITKSMEAKKAAHDAAKKAFEDAVAAYKAKPWEKVVVEPEGGVARLVGADRYETSALTSVYLTSKLTAFSSTAREDAAGTKYTSFKRVYIASGDDAHLIDSVVAGQLINGPIVLVPTSGSLPENTGKEFKRLANLTNTPAAYFVIGGENAVPESMVDEAAKASTGAA